MREASRTTRERIADALRETPMDVPTLATEFDLTSSAVLSHVDHIAKSLDGTDEQLLVAPPTCRECGFDDYDDLINRPSRCPECKHEDITPPTFAVE
ncbi:transcriptional regulator [Halapricum sp. CBA1109]|jgi:predicted Zn-ribbon and HTH transcriptional regulator|uniref:transcriptional regulator n=1 Tax=Halapricum sp. CBA1109 TaxID=2668068 RepID=UPI0012FB37B1|nr:transcriptional regulator [Halapricum sp. CBA1109]MUV90289.1 transcriptional regulator [Halapricum sp. CBA1109]